jgi:hypothetical protein
LADAARQPLLTYAVMIAFGLLPTALVTRFYGILSHRLVIQWDTFGNITVIGTRPATVLMIANVAAVIALAATAVAIWQHRALLQLGARRAFLALNLAQITAINLVCAMIVSDALGLQLKIKPMIPPAMSLVLFAAGMLCWRLDQSRPGALTRIGAFVLISAGLLLLGFSALAINAAVGYYASAVALLAMIAVALPQRG